MSQAQYNHYMALAAQYRQRGRNSIADALERQAQAELEKPAMDVSDLTMNEREAYNDTNVNAKGEQMYPSVTFAPNESDVAMAEREKYNDPNEIASYTPTTLTADVAPVTTQPTVENPAIPREVKPEIPNNYTYKGNWGATTKEDPVPAYVPENQQTSSWGSNTKEDPQPVYTPGDTNTASDVLAERDNSLQEINPKTGKPYGNDLLYRGLSGAYAYGKAMSEGSGNSILEERDKQLAEINPKTGKPYGSDLVNRAVTGAYAYPASWISNLVDNLKKANLK